MLLQGDPIQSSMIGIALSNNEDFSSMTRAATFLYLFQEGHAFVLTIYYYYSECLQ